VTGADAALLGRGLPHDKVARSQHASTRNNNDRQVSKFIFRHFQDLKKCHHGKEMLQYYAMTNFQRLPASWRVDPHDTVRLAAALENSLSHSAFETQRGMGRDFDRPRAWRIMVPPTFRR
jgi:hypothetical protein